MYGVHHTEHNNNESPSLMSIFRQLSYMLKFNFKELLCNTHVKENQVGF